MTTNWAPRSARSGWLAGVVAGAALVATVAFVNFTPAAHSAPPPAAVANPGSFADVVESVSPAVVNIMVTQVSEAQPTLGLQRFGAPHRAALLRGGLGRPPPSSVERPRTAFGPG